MKVKSINKKYGERSVLKNINLDMDNNGMVFILGSSGSGKSTLLNTLGLLDDDYEGDIIYDKDSVEKEAQRTELRKKHIAFIFQEFNLINSLSVRENIKTAVDISGGTFDEERYKEIIEMFNLTELEEQNVSTLSGGEKQRVAIARALIRNNEVIYADEPTGNLDEKNSEIIFSALKRLSENHLVIVVSHNKEAAEIYADRIITIRDGEIFEDSDRGYSSNSVLSFDNDRPTNPKASKWTRKISLRSFSMRKKKLLPSMISILTALLCVGLVCGVYSAINGIISMADTSIMEADKLEIMSSDFESVSMSEDFVNSIKADPNVKQATAYINYIFPTEEKDGSSEGVGVVAIDLNDFYKDRIMLKCGEMIKGDGEVLVDIPTAEKLFDTAENAVGKEFPLGDEGNRPKIVGVTTQKKQGATEMTITLTNDYLKKLIKQDINNEASSVLLNVNLSDEQQEGINARTYGADFSPKLLYGRMPKTENEVLLDAGTLNDMLGYLSSTYQSKENIKSGKVSEKLINKIFDDTYDISLDYTTKLADVRIVGICETSESDYENYNMPILYISSDSIGTYIDRAASKMVVYLNDYSESSIESITSTINEAGYSTIYEADGIRMLFTGIFSAIGMAIGIAAIIIIIISCVIVSFATKSNISDRIYEIGVLKSLGADRKSIFKIFSIENLIMGLIDSATAVLVLVILTISGLPSWATVMGVSFYSFEWWHIIAIAMVGLFITMISGIGKMNKAAKLSVTDAIRTKNI